MRVAFEWRTATPDEPVRDEEISVILLPRARGALPAAVMGAVKRAAPFAPPPTHLRDALSKYGVVLQFRP